MARPLDPHSPHIFKDSARGERLQRFLADSGIASRRACEDLIREGRITVNGIKVTDLPAFINPAEDHVVFDGRGIPKRGGSDARQRHEYVMLYKPERTLVATRDEPGLDRRTVMELVNHPSGARLFPVGRLDYETTGLLLLTTDGNLTNLLTHPKFAVPKTYEVIVKDQLDGAALAELRQALRKFEKQAAKRAAHGAPAEVSPIEVELVQQKAGKSLLRVTLKESRNREIRQMLAAAGLTVHTVERVAIGPLMLSGVRLGSWRDLEKAEVKMLYKAASAAAGGRVSKGLDLETEDGSPARAVSRRAAKAVAGTSRQSLRDQRRATASRRAAAAPPPAPATPDAAPAAPVKPNSKPSFKVKAEPRSGSPSAPAKAKTSAVVGKRGPRIIAPPSGS